MLGGVFLLAEKGIHHKNRSRRVRSNVRIRGASALAPLVLAGYPSDISRQCNLGHHLCMVGFSPLPVGLPNRLALDAGDN